MQGWASIPGPPGVQVGRADMGMQKCPCLKELGCRPVPPETASVGSREPAALVCLELLPGREGDTGGKTPGQAAPVSRHLAEPCPQSPGRHWEDCVGGTLEVAYPRGQSWSVSHQPPCFVSREQLSGTRICWPHPGPALPLADCDLRQGLAAAPRQPWFCEGIW